MIEKVKKDIKWINKEGEQRHAQLENQEQSLELLVGRLDNFQASIVDQLNSAKKDFRSSLDDLDSIYNDKTDDLQNSIESVRQIAKEQVNKKENELMETFNNKAADIQQASSDLQASVTKVKK